MGLAGCVVLAAVCRMGGAVALGLTGQRTRLVHGQARFNRDGAHVCVPCILVIESRIFAVKWTPDDPIHWLNWLSRDEASLMR